MLIKTSKRIHPTYVEFENLVKSGKLQSRYLNEIGKFQYFYESDKGEISLIKLNAIIRSGFLWEIYCVDGNLFEDVERFDTKKEAEKRIYQLLK